MLVRSKDLTVSGTLPFRMEGRAAVVSFADYEIQNDLWVTIVENPFYPDYWTPLS